MARYRRVSIKIWGDARFRSLSAPKPNAQTLFMFLITGSHTSVIPGLCEGGEARISESLGWPLAAFRRCFAEIAAMGMAEADWRARVIWVPKAVKHNEPASPSVVKEWARALEEIPECVLKAKAVAAITSYLRNRGPSWLAAWPAGQPAGQLDGQGAGEPGPHQEQEQEQEQEQDRLDAPADAAETVLLHDEVREPEIVEPVEVLFGRFWTVYPRRVAKKHALKTFRALKPTAALVDEMLKAIDDAKISPDWNRDGGRYIPYPATWLRGERWKDEPRPASRFRTDMSGLQRFAAGGRAEANGHDRPEMIPNDDRPAETLG
jgi:hypothetical protein